MKAMMKTNRLPPRVLRAIAPRIRHYKAPPSGAPAEGATKRPMSTATEAMASVQPLVNSERLAALREELQALKAAEELQGPHAYSAPSMFRSWAQPPAFDWTHSDVYIETRKPVNEATTLPGAVYHDESFARLEQERLWAASWVGACELSDLANPGDVMPVTIAGSPIILANDKGTIRAFHNVCRHRGAQLVSEKCTNRRTILCPYHRWGYALDGRLVGTPAFDADPSGKAIPEKLREQFKTGHVKDFDKAANGLHKVRVDTAMGLIFVNLNGEAPTLQEWLGDLLNDELIQEYEENLTKLHVVRKKQYGIDANWKLLIENYLEYYHLPAVHPDLCNVSGVDEHNRFQGTGMYMGFTTDPLTAGGTAIDPGRLPFFPGLSEKAKTRANHIAIFPNVFFSLYPDCFFRIIVTPDPKDPTKAIESACLQTHEEAMECTTTLEENFAFWNNVNTEDIQICEKVQIGTKAAPYRGGRFSFRFEEPVHRFQNMVVDKVLSEESTRYRIPLGDDARGGDPTLVE